MERPNRDTDLFDCLLERARSASYLPFAMDLLERTKCARCSIRPGSAAWFAAARKCGCVEKAPPPPANPSNKKTSSDINESISLPIMLCVVL